MKPVISTMYEMQSQFDQLEEGRLDKNLLYECTNLPGNLFIVMISQMGVVTPTTEAIPQLRITVENLKSKV